MTQPIHTPFPWHPPHICDDSTPCNCTSIVDEQYAGGICSVHVNNGIALISEGGNDAPPIEEARANARLIYASAKAFDSAARKLGVNAVEFSERMADGGIAELVRALEAAHKESRAWRDGVNVRSRNMHEAKVGAAYASEVAIIDALARVRGGAS